MSIFYHINFSYTFICIFYFPIYIIKIPKIFILSYYLYQISCNAPDSMRQVSASYSPLLPCHLLVCCILSCQHVHFILHTCSSHASEHFPRCLFCNPALLCPPAFPFVSCCEWVLNFLGMARVLPSGLCIAPVDRLSSFVPFGGRLVLQRLTELARKPPSICSPTPF